MDARKKPISIDFSPPALQCPSGSIGCPLDLAAMRLLE
jgi:hypothetical protein